MNFNPVCTPSCTVPARTTGWSKKKRTPGPIFGSPAAGTPLSAAASGPRAEAHWLVARRRLGRPARPRSRPIEYPIGCFLGGAARAAVRSGGVYCGVCPRLFWVEDVPLRTFSKTLILLVNRMRVLKKVLKGTHPKKSGTHSCCGVRVRSGY
jgi:hypothetical protein